uniref:Uncharacterized protein n=1 Tax=Trieres chinensis TaxID=1514140 RepID=A0A7S1ZE59_TRICV|mmetsp:Transcript_23501/g.47679  ORF Transcript_23501/g.47679 Transcript_23501/m.47679 type:complete len:121 (+) Transcript_23501:146-508(+)
MYGAHSKTKTKKGQMRKGRKPTFKIGKPTRSIDNYISVHLKGIVGARQREWFLSFPGPDLKLHIRKQMNINELLNKFAASFPFFQSQIRNIKMYQHYIQSGDRHIFALFGPFPAFIKRGC